jgi:hypothetical protein
MDDFCQCEDWEPCACGNQPPRHCMWCCHDLTDEQLDSFDFKNWEFIPPRPRELPTQISCGTCGMTIDNPTQQDIDHHFRENHGKT